MNGIKMNENSNFRIFFPYLRVLMVEMKSSLSYVEKFRYWLIELTSFKSKLLIRFIINKPC